MLVLVVMGEETNGVMDAQTTVTSAEEPKSPRRNRCHDDETDGLPVLVWATLTGSDCFYNHDAEELVTDMVQSFLCRAATVSSIERTTPLQTLKLMCATRGKHVYDKALHIETKFNLRRPCGLSKFWPPAHNEGVVGKIARHAIAEALIVAVRNAVDAHIDEKHAYLYEQTMGPHLTIEKQLVVEAIEGDTFLRELLSS